MKPKQRQSPERQKISAMVLKVGEGYLQIGETKEERENLLRSTCTAWNIALLPIMEREHLIQRYIGIYQTLNNSDAEDCQAVEDNLRLLIKQKDTLYPDVNVRILDSRIDIIDGKEKAFVISETLD